MNNTQQPKTNNLPEWYEIEFKKQADRIKELEAWQKHDIELAEAVGFERAHKLQADRIAELEKEKQERALQRLSDFTQEADSIAKLERLMNFWKESYNELRTTPQTKPLTDEEILDYVTAFSLDMGSTYEFTEIRVMQMIRAIEAKIRGE